jgi:hypothetical protein
MWIFFRLVLAALGFGFRVWSRRSLGKAQGDHKGWLYYVKSNKKEKDVIWLGMALESPSWIRMHEESKLDRFFKKVGIASELQTGDAAFDECVYVTSDHPAVEALLTNSAPLRAAVLRAFDMGATCVRYDGSALWLDRLPASEATEGHLDALAALCEASTPLSQGPGRWFADRFLWKALLIEGVVWSIFGYATGAIIEHIVTPEDLHVWTMPLVGAGLAVALLMFVAVLGVITLTMRGSSRGHRIVIESAVLLAIGFPLTGIQLVGDTNRGLDNSAVQVVSVSIARCDVRERLFSRRKTKVYYAVTYDSPATAPDDPPAPEFPSEIRVSRSLCDALTDGGDLRVELAAGRWGIPWYRQLHIGGETWTAPH